MLNDTLNSIPIAPKETKNLLNIANEILRRTLIYWNDTMAQEKAEALDGEGKSKIFSRPRILDRAPQTPAERKVRYTDRMRGRISN